MLSHTLLSMMRLGIPCRSVAWARAEGESGKEETGGEVKLYPHEGAVGRGTEWSIATERDVGVCMLSDMSQLQATRYPPPLSTCKIWMHDGFSMESLRSYVYFMISKTRN